jgi:hypothetical protein
MGGFISKLRRARGKHGTKVRAGASTIIGNTPLIDLSRLSGTPGVKIMAKCEYLNPSGSIKAGRGLGLPVLSLRLRVRGLNRSPRSPYIQDPRTPPLSFARRHIPRARGAQVIRGAQGEAGATHPLPLSRFLHRDHFVVLVTAAAVVSRTPYGGYRGSRRERRAWMAAWWVPGVGGRPGFRSCVGLRFAILGSGGKTLNPEPQTMNPKP